MASGPQMVGGSNQPAPAGGVSGGLRPDLESKASQSLICGLIRLVCSGTGVALVLGRSFSASAPSLSNLPCDAEPTMACFRNIEHRIDLRLHARRNLPVGRVVRPDTS
jgi:hypothetical protein